MTVDAIITFVIFFHNKFSCKINLYLMLRVHCYFTNGFMLLPLNTSLIKIKCKLIRFNTIEKKNDEFDVIILYEIIIKHHVFYGK